MRKSRDQWLCTQSRSRKGPCTWERSVRKSVGRPCTVHDTGKPKGKRKDKVFFIKDTSLNSLIMRWNNWISLPIILLRIETSVTNLSARCPGSCHTFDMQLITRSIAWVHVYGGRITERVRSFPSWGGAVVDMAG